MYHSSQMNFEGQGALTGRPVSRADHDGEPLAGALRGALEAVQRRQPLHCRAVMLPHPVGKTLEQRNKTLPNALFVARERATDPG